jgi:hypothetical protein
VVLSQHSHGEAEKNYKASTHRVFVPRFESGNFRIRSRSGTHTFATLSSDVRSSLTVLSSALISLPLPMYISYSHLFFDSSVGIATGYGLDDQGEREFTSPYRPDRLWGPPNLL